VQVSQKCQYAVRGLFELAKNAGKNPIKTADIADAQGIPKRFLEGILNQLKQTKWISSIRGKQGGYRLRVDPKKLTVGDVVRFIDGSLAPVSCVDHGGKEIGCTVHKSCVFVELWRTAGQAMERELDDTSFADLILRQMKQRGGKCRLRKT